MTPKIISDHMPDREMAKTVESRIPGHSGAAVLTGSPELRGLKASVMRTLYFTLSRGAPSLNCSLSAKESPRRVWFF